MLKGMVLIIASAIVLAGSWLNVLPAADIPAIAAASDVKFTLTEIADRFRGETGRTVRISYGSSGDFRRQIAQGAPFELFLSADESYVQALQEEGFTLDRGILYGLGRLALYVPHGSSLTPDAELLNNLATALKEGRLRRFAIANPEHAPYGRAAREVLVKLGLWDRIQNHLVLGENAAQAVQFVISGSAQGGFIPLALALASEVSSRGRFVVVSPEWHSPLRQRMVLLRNAGDTARRFYAFIQGPVAWAIFERYGFVRPD
jgi:molybdate transport system substrate-binding protein